MTLIFITILGHGGISLAQWTKIYDFGNQVSSIYFLDLPSSPRIGFVGTDDGLNEKLWKTTDGGNTWRVKLIQPHQGTWTYTSSVTFKDSLYGWCSFYGGVYETKDGGEIWNQALTDTGLFTVYYCPYNGYLYKGPITSEYSADEGVTWQTFDSRNIDVGYMMNSSGVGIATHYGPESIYYTTIDSGKTWTSSNELMWEAFQGVSIPGTNIFFAVHDSDYWGQLSDVWGLDPVVSVGGGGGNGYLNPRTSTGCIAGTLCELYVQTSDGFVVSTDSGWNWTFIGGPGNLVDTRFFVKGEDVYAGDEFGGLWHLNQDALAPSLQTALNDDTIELGNFNNCSSYDTSFTLANLLTCDDIMVDSIYMGTSSTITPTSIPSGLHAIKIGMADTIKLHFNPIGDTTFLTTVNIITQLDSQNYTFHIPVRASSYTNRSALLYPPDTLHAQACLESVSFLSFTNNGCYPLVIDSIGTPSDASISSTNFPRKVDSGTIIGVHLNSSESGSRNEAFHVYYQVYNGVDTVRVDSVLMFSELISRGIPSISLSANTLDFGTVPTCGGQSVTLPVVISSTGCDTLSYSVATPSSPFILNTKSLSSLPVGTGDTALVTFTPTQSGSFYDTLIINTNAGTETVSLQGVGVAGASILSVDTSLRDFGALYACETRDTQITLYNTGCDTLIVDSASLSNVTYATGTTFPLVILPRDSVTMRVFLIGDTSGMNGTLEFFSNADQGSSTATIPLSASSIEPAQLHLSLSASQSGKNQETVIFYLILSGEGSVGAVDSLNFNLSHNDDLLSFANESGVSVHRGTPIYGMEMDTFVWHGIPLIPDTIGTLTYQVYLTDSSTTPLTLSNISFGNSLGLPSDCIARIDDSGSGFTYIYQCGEPLIQDAMLGEPFSITGIVPNPAQNVVQVSGTGFFSASGMGIELFDILGRPQTVKSTLSSNEMTLDVSSVPSGAYYLRLTALGYVQTRKLSIQR